MASSPFNRDIPQTKAAIGELLKDGTPDWYKHPEDYRSFAEDEYYREHENSCQLAADHLVPDQEFLTDQSICPDSERLVHFMHVKTFFEKLRGAGVKCFMQWNRIQQQAAIYALVPGEDQKGHKYITYLHIPYMPEWSTWNVDPHGLLNGESARGWRTVLYYLIKEKVITEKKVEELFGAPRGPASTLHRKALWNLRNQKQPEKEK